MRKTLATLSLLLLGLNNSFAQWQKLNMPEGGEITKVEALPSNPDTWYAIGKHQLFITQNAGTTWTPMVVTGVSGNVAFYDFTLGAKNYALTDGRLYTISGNQLTRINTFQPSGTAERIFTEGNTILVLCRSGFGLSYELMISHDNGLNWTIEALGQNEELITVIPLNYQGTLHLFACTSSEVRHSTDTAKTWNSINTTVLDGKMLVDMVINNNMLVVLVNDNNHVYTRTLDNPAWSEMNQGLQPTAQFNKLYNAAGKLFLKETTNNQIHYYQNTWVPATGNTDSTHVSYIGGIANKYLLATSIGVAQSTDNVNTIQYKNNGIAHHDLFDVLIENQAIYLASLSGLYQYNPATQQTTNITPQSNDREFKRITKIGNTYVAQSSQSIYTSTNGTTWVNKTPAELTPNTYQIRSVAFKNNTNEMVIITEWDNRIFHSSDAGNAWVELPNAPTSANLATFKGDSLVVFSADGKIHYYVNNTWSDNNKINYDFSNQQAIASTSYGSFVSSSSGGIFKLNANWSDGTLINFDTNNPGAGSTMLTTLNDTLFVLNYFGLHYTTNGISWTPISTSQTATAFGGPNNIVINNPYVYLPTANGLYRQPLSNLSSGLTPPQYDELSFQVYPNPAADKLFIQTKTQGKLTVSIIDITGQLIRQQEIGTDNSISLDEFKQGLYFLQITSSTGTYMHKFIKE